MIAPTHNPDNVQFRIPPSDERRTAPTEVPAEFARDFNQAARVLAESPEASAALTRRAIQHILNDKGGFTQRDLVKQMDAAIASGTLPSHVTELLHAARHIGNFAAHPTKSLHTGEIMEVEPEEAELNLDVVEALLDFYFVQAARNQARLTRINQKLQEAGKQPLTEPATPPQLPPPMTT